MFRKNVPPDVVQHTEGRSFGPSKMHIQPACFSDSESDMQNSGSSFSGKIQMIIDGLRSSQSSADLASDFEAHGPAGHHVPKARSRNESENIRAKEQLSDSMKEDFQNQKSDDSLDREIEEAIQEYLEEKGYKKENPIQRQVQVTKQLRRGHRRSNLCKKSNNKIHRTNKVEENKRAKEQHSDSMKKDSQSQISEHMKRKGSKAATHKNISSLKPKKGLKILMNHSHQANYVSASTSSDGPEKEIPMYQCEKRNKPKHSEPLQPKESSSSSDDGIEEAIRQYKIEKQKKKHKYQTEGLKPPEIKQARVSATVTHTSDQPSVSETQEVRKKRVQTKNKREALKVVSSPQAVTCYSSSTKLSTCVFKGNCISLTESSASLKVNSTAELMSPEVSPDVSKFVMKAIPENTMAFIASSVPPIPVFSVDLAKDSESHNGIMVDNESIAQETTKLLELKGQKQSFQKTNTKNFKKVEDTTKLLQKKKKEPSQNVKIRLSLSRKRKLKDVQNIQESFPLENLAPCTQNSHSLSDTSNVSSETCPDLDMTPPKDAELMKAMVESKSPQDKKGAQSSKSYEEHLENLNQHILKSEELKTAGSTREEKASRHQSCSLDGDKVLSMSVEDFIKIRNTGKTNTMDKDKSKKTVRFGAVQLIVPKSEKTTIIKPKSSPSQVPTKSCISKSETVTVKQDLINNKCLKMALQKSTAEEHRSVDIAKPFVKLSVEKQAQTGVAKAGEVDTSYNMTASGSVRAGEVRTESQQAEYHYQQNEGYCSGGMKAAVPQRTPSGLQIFSGRTTPTSTASLESLQLKLVKVKEPKTTMSLEKLSPLVTGKKIKRRRLVDHITSSTHSNSLPTTEDVPPQSRGQIILNKNVAVSTRAGEVAQTLNSDHPCTIRSHLARSPDPATHVSRIKFPKIVEVYYSNAIIIDQQTTEPHTDASMPCPTQTPSFFHTRQDRQGRFSASSSAKMMTDTEKDKGVTVELSTHRTSHMQIRNMDLHLADKTRGNKGKGQEMKAEEGDLYAAEEAEYLDETDYDSDGREGSSQTSQKRKRPHKMSLSTSIDPGMNISPYIMLETPQRYQKYMKSRKLVFMEQEQKSKMLPTICLHQNTKGEQQKTSSNMLLNVKTFYAKTPTKGHSGPELLTLPKDTELMKGMVESASLQDRKEDHIKQTHQRTTSIFLICDDLTQNMKQLPISFLKNLDPSVFCLDVQYFKPHPKHAASLTWITVNGSLEMETN
ncbi:protein phosphatase 1 regulatory subunit 26-like isoform X1 [Arapaima gigas]